MPIAVRHHFQSLFFQYVHPASPRVGKKVRALSCWIVLLTAGFLFALYPAEQACAERVQLQVWGMSMGEARMGWYALIDAFQKKYPNIEVVIGPTDRGQDLQKLLCGIVGSSPPDVFRRESPLFGSIAARDILMPLDGFVEADRSRDDGLHEEDFLPGAWQSGKSGGILYAIIEDSNPAVFAYNRALFREAGLDPDKPPRTWQEWYDATEKLTVRDASGRVVRLGTAAFRIADPLMFYIAQCGGKVLSEDGRRCTLNTPEGIKALTFMKSMFDVQGGRKSVDQFVSATTGPEQFDPFSLGKIAISVEDDWVLYRVMQYNPNLELGIAPLPTPDGQNPISISTMNTMFMIPKNARHPKEAWDFIRFLNTPESQIAYADARLAYGRTLGQVQTYTGLRPNRPVQKVLSAKYAPNQPYIREGYNRITTIMETLIPVPVSPVSGVLGDEAFRARDRASYAEMTIQETLNDATARVQEELDLFHSRESFPFIRWAVVWATLVIVVVVSIGLIAYRSRGERAQSSLQRHENRMGLIFISPWVCGLLCFVIGPMVFSLAISFCDYDIIHRARFVGLRNYYRLFTQDPLLWKSLKNTIYMALALPLGMAASLAIALLLNANVKGMSIYRTVFYLPAITPTVAAAVLWFALLNPDGLINAALNDTICKWLGYPAPAWLQDPYWSKPAIVVMGLWGAGGGMILWLAGLQGIPQQLYEAAAIDGAGVFRRFWSITMPMLTPYIFFSIVVGIIGVFQIFSQSLILTQGGPSDSTLFYVYYLFNNAFRYFKMGYASAQAWLLFVIVLILTLIQWHLSKRWVHYE